MKKVVKFGGSSLASAKQFKKVADIVKAEKSRRYVVPSAPGKRKDGDEKVTDLLYQCYDIASEGGAYNKVFGKIKDRFAEIIDGLELNLNLAYEFDRIEENFVKKAAGKDNFEAGMLMSLLSDMAVCQVVDPLKTVRVEFPLAVLETYGYRLP